MSKEKYPPVGQKKNSAKWVIGKISASESKEKFRQMGHWKNIRQ
jgi:hypothetical protein